MKQSSKVDKLLKEVCDLEDKIFALQFFEPRGTKQEIDLLCVKLREKAKQLNKLQNK